MYGLIDKKACVRVLNTEDIGTFIIRFSDSTPGSFAVAYVTDDPKERVKHYLIKPEDVGMMVFGGVSKNLILIKRFQ